jgi:HD-GYP domain-containing protein (c-di-GMP phosphodiesterase class II)
MPTATTEKGERTPAARSREQPSASEVLDELSQLFGRVKGLCTEHKVHRVHPGIISVHHENFVVLLTPAHLWTQAPQLFETWREPDKLETTSVLLLGQIERQQLAESRNLGLFGLLARDPSDSELVLNIERAFDWMHLKTGQQFGAESLTRSEYEFGKLAEIARALTTERDIERLLGLILEKSRIVTGSDAGSLYVVEGATGGKEARRLHFKLSQNDSVKFDWSEFTMPVDRNSMAGWVALERQTIRIDDVYEPSKSAAFGFDRSFDERTGYRTKSMICTPLTNNRGDVLGVLQLINKKRRASVRLSNASDVDQHVVPFDERSEQVLTAVAAQAGIALENALLYDEIRGLFDGFVRASVDAIESRDPTTSGHSRRVATLTLQLANAVERCETGSYATVRWRGEDLRELEYASLLHDFGKIGVKEQVLTKAKKLYGYELERIRTRFDFIAKSLEANSWARKYEALRQGAGSDAVFQIESEYLEQRAELEQTWTIVEQANEPTVLSSGEFSRIQAIGKNAYPSLGGQPQAWLTDDEITSLSVKRGSLTSSEFDEIRGHVSHTFRFLSRIPWGRTFAKVPVIAGAHHERLNGTGYPNRLTSDQIPIQSKMMSVADIFDALTASDRPYKRAVPTEKAIDILGFEVKDGHLDKELVQLFVDSKAWESLAAFRDAPIKF